VIRAGQALAEKERALISQRTKAALKAGKACGVSLAVKALPRLVNLSGLPCYHSLLRHLLHQ
jgi:DNA invertase Pin-like site-specific DNA recombinase